MRGKSPSSNRLRKLTDVEKPVRSLASDLGRLRGEFVTVDEELSNPYIPGVPPMPPNRTPPPC